MSKLHPDAADSFNAQGIRLLDSVELQPGFPSLERDTFQPDRYVTETIDEIVGRIVMKRSNPLTGEEFDIFVSLDRGVGCLAPKDASELRALSAAISKCNPFSGKVGMEFIEALLLDWIADSLEGKAMQQMAAYIEERIDGVVRRCEVWIPIANLHLESPIELGGVAFRQIPKSLLEARATWQLSSVNETDAEAVRRQLEKDRSKLQGLAAGVVQLEAEPSFATRTALETVEEILAYLRVYHAANASWRTTSQCLPLGSEGADTLWAFVLEGDKVILEANRYRWSAPEPWLLSDDIVRELHHYITALSRLLAVRNPTRFQRCVRDSLLLYSRNNTTRHIADKLVFILVALETLLLKDPQESIQQNMAERFAFLMSSEAPKREELVKLLKAVYSLRSRYVHHGSVPTETSELDTFLREAWVFFMRLPLMSERYKTREDLFDHLDHLKYS